MKHKSFWYSHFPHQNVGTKNMLVGTEFCADPPWTMQDSTINLTSCKGLCKKIFMLSLTSLSETIYCMQLLL